MASFSIIRSFSLIQYSLLLHCILYLDAFYAVILSFKPSDTAIPDDYCLEQLSWDGNIIKYDSIPSYCDDIDNILTDYCGNTTFYTSFYPDYNASNARDDECIFYLDDQQIITKTYVISDQIPINRITFSSNNTSHLLLSQSFLSITSYNGSINISNLNVSSNASSFSFVHIASYNTALDITLMFCHFIDMNADNGSIINVPHNNVSTQYFDAISITFDRCIVERTNSQYGGILYIERNNVYVTFSECDMNDIGSNGAGSGAIIHWLCQSSNNEDDLCGEVLISNTNIIGSDDTLFTIDLSLDPSQIHFVLNVDTSVFTNISGTIFNFNHNDDELGPFADRIQDQNAFIHINNSRFEDNGLQKDTIQQWNRYRNNYIPLTGYTNNGTIFSINSFTVPSITIENSNFTHNAALYGTIFYWYCSRNVRWIKDNYCGSITLKKSLFQQNKIDPFLYFPRYGSLMYTQMRYNMQFDLWIHQSSFIKHSGNLIYFEESAYLDDYTNANFSNYTQDTNLDSSISMIFVDDSQFIECNDDLSSNGNSMFGAIFTIRGLQFLKAFITRSLFEGNECNAGTAIFLADYSLMLSITDSNFTNNSAIKDGGLFAILEEEDGIIEISGSRFVDNGYDNYQSQVSILSTATNTQMSIDITRSQFIQNKHGTYGCFKVHAADIYITHSLFEGNEGKASPVILFMKSNGDLNISHSIFRENTEISTHFDADLAGMFHVDSANIFNDNVTFANNTVWNSGIYTNSPHIIVIRSNFVNNYGYKSSIFSRNDDVFTLHLSQSNFTDNTVDISEGNGSIIAVSAADIDITIIGCIFANNEANNGYGGALYIEGDGTVSISNSTMLRNTAAGAGGFLFAIASSSLIITISDSYAKQNTGGFSGGALYLEQSILHLKRVDFINNGAGAYGGAIQANENNTIHATQCYFDHNLAIFGGAMYIFRSLFIFNESESNANDASRQGGFLYMDQSNLYMNNVRLMNDNADINGGTIFMVNSSRSSYFECNHCNITNATAAYGAMLHAEEGNIVSLYDSKVTGCKAGIAVGVLYLERNCVLNITESHFYENSGGSYAGVIFLTDNIKMHIWNSIFSRNTALVGGAIAILTGDENNLYISIESTSFTDNTAHQTGGVLYIKTIGSNLVDSYYHNIDLKQGNEWRGNKAMYGGAIAMDFRTTTATGITAEECDPDILTNQYIDITSNAFTNNSAQFIGGALYLRCMQLNIINSQFDSNHASSTNSGGSAYLSNTKTYISGSEFLSTTRNTTHDGDLFYINALDNGICHFTLGNSRIYGFTKDVADNISNYTADYSLIAVGSVPFMSFNNVSYTNNGIALFYDQTFVCANIEFINCAFTNNYGWTVIDMNHITYREPHAITTFNNVLFEDNIVTFGLIRLETSYTKIYNTQIKNNINTLLISTFILVYHLTLQHSQIMKNHGKYDGIITIHELGIANISDSEFTDNTVGGIGGVLHSKAAVLNIHRSQFINNTAILNGGHIAQYEGELNIEHCTFIDGQAVLGNGGAIWLSRNNILSGTIATIKHTTFERNSAAFHGGAILQDTPSKNKRNALSLTSVNFSANEAGHSGSAIYIRNKYDISFTSQDVIYSQNKAYVIDNDLESWPFEYSLTSSQTQICPGCNVSIAMNASNLFHNAWIPHNFTELLFSTDSVPDDYQVTATTQIAEFALATERTFEVLQGMKSMTSGQISIIYQSDTFTYGVGQEIFTYGPAIFNETVILTMTGYTMDGFVAIDTVHIAFDVMLCEPHHRATTFDDGSFICSQCPQNTYRFMRTATEDCRLCPFGAVCFGGDQIYVQNDYYPLITETGLEALQCSPGSCCLSSLCLVSEIESLCPQQRDASSTMCSVCEEGYSVAPLATECIECDGVNPWYFIIPAIVYALLIWWWGHRDPLKDNLAAWEIYTFKILSFYYQVLPSIHLLITDAYDTETTDLSGVIESIFNFDPKIEGICAYDKLTNLQQLLLSFVTPATCLMWVIIFWFFNRIGCCEAVRNKMTTRYDDAKCEKLGTLIFTFFFLRAFVKFFLQVYAQLTRTSFSLLSCREFNGEQYMYYSADIKCWQPWHALAFFCAICSCLLPLIALHLLRKARKNQQISAWWHILTCGYKRRAWWYDTFRMACRLFIVLLVTIPVLEAYRLVLIRWLIYSYLIIHIWVHPYSNKIYAAELGFNINHLETCTLVILCILVHLADYEQIGVLSAYKTLKLLPAIGLIVLMLYVKIISKFFPDILPPAPVPSARTVDNFISPQTTKRSRTQLGLTGIEAGELEMQLRTIQNTQANTSRRSPFLSPMSANHHTRRGNNNNNNYFISPQPSALSLNLGEEIESYQDDDFEEELNVLSSIGKLSSVDVAEKAKRTQTITNQYVHHSLGSLFKKVTRSASRENVIYSSVPNDTPADDMNVKAQSYEKEYGKIDNLVKKLSNRARTLSSPMRIRKHRSMSRSDRSEVRVPVTYSKVANKSIDLDALFGPGGKFAEKLKMENDDDEVVSETEYSLSVTDQEEEQVYVD